MLTQSEEPTYPRPKLHLLGCKLRDLMQPTDRPIVCKLLDMCVCAGEVGKAFEELEVASGRAGTTINLAEACRQDELVARVLHGVKQFKEEVAKLELDEDVRSHHLLQRGEGQSQQTANVAMVADAMQCVGHAAFLIEVQAVVVCQGKTVEYVGGRPDGKSDCKDPTAEKFKALKWKQLLIHGTNTVSAMKVIGSKNLKWNSSGRRASSSFDCRPSSFKFHSLVCYVPRRSDMVWLILQLRKERPDLVGAMDGWMDGKGRVGSTDRFMNRWMHGLTVVWVDAWMDAALMH